MNVCMLFAPLLAATALCHLPARRALSIAPAPVLGPPRLPCAARNCTRILSWNAHGLPLQHDTPRRLIAIVDVIRTELPDIVVLQEVWLACYQDLLVNALRFAYDPVAERRGGFWGPKGGLLVLVRTTGPWRLRPEERYFTEYDASVRLPSRVLEGDQCSRKGAVRMHLDGPAGPLCLIATHLQSQYQEKGRDHLYPRERSEQLRQLREIEDGCGSETTVVAGDFNTAPSESLYGEYLRLLGGDLTSHAREECDGGCGSHFAYDGAKWEWIDYLISPTVGVTAEVARVVNVGIDRPYSDHDGLLARIALPHVAQ